MRHWGRIVHYWPRREWRENLMSEAVYYRATLHLLRGNHRRERTALNETR
jgi:hypothetical protein